MNSSTNRYRYSLLALPVVLLLMLMLLTVVRLGVAQDEDTTWQYLPVIISQHSPAADKGPQPVKDEFLVNADTRGYDDHAVVAVSRGGIFSAAWHSDGTQGGLDVMVRQFDEDGMSLFSERPVNTTRERIQSNPAIDTDKAELGIIVWSAENEGGEWDTMGRLTDSLGWRTAQFQVNSPDNASAPEPHPATCMFKNGPRQGYAVVVWNDRISVGETRYYIRVLDPDGKPLGEPLPVNEVPSQASGQLLAYLNSLPTGHQGQFGFTAIACRDTAEVVLAWERLGEQSVTVARRIDPFADPAGWPAEFEVDAPDAEVFLQRRPRISANSESFVVAWMESPTSDPDSVLKTTSHAHLFSAGSSRPIPLVADAAGGNGLPVVMMRADGRFIASWTTVSSQTEADIWMQTFSPMGVPLISPMLVSSQPDDTGAGKGYQGRPSLDGIETEAGLEFFISWESSESAEEETDVYARKYRW